MDPNPAEMARLPGGQCWAPASNKRKQLSWGRGEGWSELVLGLPECTDLRAGHYLIHSLPETSVDAVSQANQGPFQLPNPSDTD
jgi:hypothetical protein